MKTIYKYELNIEDEQYIKVPYGCEILTVQEQSGKVYMWCLVTPDNIETTKHILMFGTGHPIRESFRGKYISTFQLHNGALVFHVFDLE